MQICPADICPVCNTSVIGGQRRALPLFDALPLLRDKSTALSPFEYWHGLQDISPVHKLILLSMRKFFIFIANQNIA